MNKNIIYSLILSMFCLVAKAQSGTNSPYSQYGLGVLSDQSLGYNRGMGGLSFGLRGSNMVNMQNPASYSEVDSLTMIFDLGMSGQITNFEENGKKVNAYNSDIEYAVALFRLMPKVGLSAGIVPYTNIGYNYSEVENIGTKLNTTKKYSGSGGLHQAYIGAGWNFMKGLSLGANLSYLWGTYDKSISTVNSDTYINTLLKTYSAKVNSYKIDLGLQWECNLDDNDCLTLGLTYSHGHNLGADMDVSTVYTNSQTGISEDTVSSVKDAFSIPNTYGVGLSWRHSNNLLFGVDYVYQKWQDTESPYLNTNTGAYEKGKGLLKDRSKIVFGGEWIPKSENGNFFERIHYRFGASYATPYIIINGEDGPKEYSLNLGIGIPIQKSRSMFNLSAQWVNSSADNLITENMFRINVGITFTESWFMKWKVQ